MLTENKIIEYTSIYLENNGYKIIGIKDTTKKGIDIEAIHPKKGKCFVEAKGETSSKKGTKRYGKPFTISQIKTHIGVALLKTFQIKQESEISNVLIALPFEENHKKIINSIMSCLIKTNIKILYVKENGDVEEK